MLEKKLGCTLLAKLRAILLMEADFNHSNKEIFGSRMLDNVRKGRNYTATKLVPAKIDYICWSHLISYLFI